VLLGLGVVGVGIGAISGVKTFNTWAMVKESGHCTDGPRGYVCDDQGRSWADEAHTSGNISTGLFIGGGLAAAAGVGMLVVGFRSKAAPSNTGIQWIAPSFDGKNSGIVLQGRF
jgi:hypothetical protein